MCVNSDRTHMRNGEEVAEGGEEVKDVMEDVRHHQRVRAVRRRVRRLHGGRENNRRKAGDRLSCLFARARDACSAHTHAVMSDDEGGDALADNVLIEAEEEADAGAEIQDDEPAQEAVQEKRKRKKSKKRKAEAPQAEEVRCDAADLSLHRVSHLCLLHSLRIPTTLYRCALLCGRPLCACASPSVFSCPLRSVISLLFADCAGQPEETEPAGDADEDGPQEETEPIAREEAEEGDVENVNGSAEGAKRKKKRGAKGEEDARLADADKQARIC